MKEEEKKSVVIFVLNGAIEWNSWFIKCSYGITSSKVWDVMWLCGNNEKFSILFYFNHIFYHIILQMFHGLLLFFYMPECVHVWLCVWESFISFNFFRCYHFINHILIFGWNFRILSNSVLIVRDCMEFYFVE